MILRVATQTRPGPSHGARSWAWRWVHTPVLSGAKGATLTPLPATDTPVPPTSTLAPTSRVVVRHGGVWNGDTPDPGIVSQMLDAGLSTLTGHTDVMAVWRALFDPGDRVLLKVNCISYGRPTQPAVRDKARLVVGAALNVSPDDWNRPARENALLLSFDPVALDTVGRDIRCATGRPWG